MASKTKLTFIARSLRIQEIHFGGSEEQESQRRANKLEWIQVNGKISS